MINFLIEEKDCFFFNKETTNYSNAYCYAPAMLHKPSGMSLTLNNHSSYEKRSRSEIKNIFFSFFKKRDLLLKENDVKYSNKEDK
jgi:uncharacterized protein YneR